MKKAELQEIISASIDESLGKCRSDNPIETWTCFVMNLDAAGRRRIGDQLAAQGRNRFTGEPMKTQKSEA